MNKVIITGRLGNDPEIRYTQSGKAVASFSLAVTEGYGDQQKTNWIPTVAWEKLAETIGNSLSKGSRVLVEGRLQIRSYEANDGQKRRIAEVVAQSIEFLDSKKQSNSDDGNIDVNSFGKDVFPDDGEIPF
jgi:single-strand DNA-binding protein